VIERQLTIRDIASIAKVSTATVSRYLNGKYEYMSADTRERIRAVIERVNWQPNAVARNLKLKQSNIIGIITSNPGIVSMNELFRGFSDALTEEQYTLMILDSHGDVELERKCLRTCCEQTDGAIIIHPSTPDFCDYNLIQASGLPLVLYDHGSPAWQYDAVSFDQYGAAHQMLSHLYEQGYRDVYYLVSPLHPLSPKKQRLAAYLDFCRKHEDSMLSPQALDVDPQDYLACRDMILRIKSADRIKGAKAVFFDSVRFLLPVMRALISENIRIPDDMAVCGYEYGHWADVITPALTAIALPYYDIAYISAKLLIKRIRHRRENRSDPLPYEKISLDIAITIR
jgi:LacI family kdg operon repressor